MDTETVPVQEQEQVPNDVQVDVHESPVTEALETSEIQDEVKEQNVPLAALQKERRKRQESEQRELAKDEELKMFREHQLKQMQETAPQEEDESQYEPITKAEFNKQLKAQNK